MDAGFAVAIACGGFLLAVLWMDLMFDVQVLRYRDAPGELPEAVLGSIAAYYRRVTTEARPMSHVIGSVMPVAVLSVLAQVVRAPASRGIAIPSLLLCGAAVGLALRRVVPNAVRLGARADSPAVQSDLARVICRDHLLCLAALIAFLVLQLFAALRQDDMRPF